MYLHQDKRSSCVNGEFNLCSAAYCHIPKSYTFMMIWIILMTFHLK